jgi:hypothetical protein
MAGKSRIKAQSRYAAFARHYVAMQCNGAQAAIAAGYSKRTADKQASELLKKPEVKKAVQSLLAGRIEKLEINVDRVLQHVAFHAYNLENSVTDQLRALRMLGEYLKLFSEDHAPGDLGVKYIVLDMPRPIRTVGTGAAALPAPSNGHNGNGNGNGSGSHE